MKYQFIVIAIVALLLNSNSWSQQTVNNQKTDKKMETAIDNNKTIIHDLYEEILNRKKTALLKDIISDEYVGVRGIKGHAGFLEPVKGLITAFPDIQWHIQEMIAEDDKVVVRWKWEGTHQAQFTNFPATGKKVSNDGQAIFTLKNGKIISGIVNTDRLGFLQQMEAVPEEVTKLSNRHAYKERVQFIDKFLVPAASIAAFYERMRINREFIKKIPGFIEDAVYQYTDETGNLICITVAQWTSREALEKAKETMLAEYKRQGIDPVEMFKKLNLVLDRGVYKEIE